MAGSNKRVFITGGNGFVASQIIKDLIEQEYQVTTSVRSDSKGQEIFERHPAWKSQLSIVVVPDFLAEQAWDHVFRNPDVRFDYIIHTASPVNFGATDFQKELINPAIQGTTGILKSAHKHGGSQIKRVVILGSCVAVLDSLKDNRSDGPDYTEKDWNSITAEQAIGSKNVVLGYNASKKLAEQAAWKFQEDHSPSFDLTVINPDVIIGPLQQYTPNAKAINATNVFAVYNFINGEYTDLDSIRFPFYHFVDVRDVSRAHILSLTAPLAHNSRIILVSDLITPQLVAPIIQRNFPELRHQIPTGGATGGGGEENPDKIFPDGVNPRGWDTSWSKKVFGEGWRYRGLEESVIDSVRDFMELEKGWK